VVIFLYVSPILFGNRGNTMSENRRNTDDQKSNALTSNQLFARISVGIMLGVVVNQAFKSDDVPLQSVPDQEIITGKAKTTAIVYKTASGEILTVRGCSQRQSRSEREPRSTERLSRAEAQDQFMLACVDRKNAEAGFSAATSTHMPAAVTTNSIKLTS
jgi:hypothetical protein